MFFFVWAVLATIVAVYALGVLWSRSDSFSTATSELKALASASQDGFRARDENIRCLTEERDSLLAQLNGAKQQQGLTDQALRVSEESCVKLTGQLASLNKPASHPRRRRTKSK